MRPTYWIWIMLWFLALLIHVVPFVDKLLYFQFHLPPAQNFPKSGDQQTERQASDVTPKVKIFHVIPSEDDAV